MAHRCHCHTVPVTQNNDFRCRNYEMFTCMLFTKMADKKTKGEDFKKFLNKVRDKRTNKSKGNECHESPEYITVQRLSKNVEGKVQKYCRIGPLTIVKFGRPLTLQNIKGACEEHFNIVEEECDVLAGERGPSFTDIAQIKKFDPLHIRFIDKDKVCHTNARHIKEINANQPSPSASYVSKSTVSRFLIPSRKRAVEAVAVTSSSLPSIRPFGHQQQRVVVASVPVSKFLKMGKLIVPLKSPIEITLEEFDVATQRWLEPVTAKFSMDTKPFAQGSFRNVYRAFGLHKLYGEYVVKQCREDMAETIINNFNSLEEHARKSVQMHALAHHLALKFAQIIPEDFGDSFSYTKLYLGKYQLENKIIFATVEKFLEGGEFTKMINNDGKIIESAPEDLRQKAETFVHYTYEVSNKDLMVVDIQGMRYKLCDPEISTKSFFDEERNVFFSAGNCAGDAIENFFMQHKCNNWCKEILDNVNKKANSANV